MQGRDDEVIQKLAARLWWDVAQRDDGEEDHQVEPAGSGDGVEWGHILDPAN
jgi:hypothetical protein